MNNFIKIGILSLSFFSLKAQNTPLFKEGNRWILVNNRIEKNEIFLTSYKKSKLKVNTLVLSFDKDARISYDYETNPNFPVSSSINYLDIDTDESSWTFDTLTNICTLTIKGGYASIDDFKFKREYKIEPVTDGFILIKEKDVFFEDLKHKKIVVTETKKKNSAVILSKNKPVTKNIYPARIQPKASQNISIDKVEPKPVSENQLIASTEAKVLKSDNLVETQPITSLPPSKINYFEQNKDLFDKNKRWILVKNKIERGDIYLTPYDESKLTINNLVMRLMPDAKIEYDYESDPKVRVCAGVDFLDIDTDETSWFYDAENNLFTLTLKGGYASLDDFKFKRTYSVELFDDGFALRRVEEHFFTDFRKPSKLVAEKKRRKK
jgi:hypothetical protein